MRSFILSLLALVAASPTLAAEKPNILFIYTDDHSNRSLSCYPEAYPFLKTPNIDKLAKEGVRFHAAYNGSWCAPSRATILTGRHPYGIESMKFIDPYPNSTYDPKQCKFWPTEFRKNGYVTAQIGKWHTGTDAGFGRDWDYQIVWNRPLHTKNAGAYYDKQLLNTNGGEAKETAGYSTDNYTKWAVEFISGKHRDAKKPWFLWLCYGATHGPITPAERYKNHYADAKVPVPKDIFGPRMGKPLYVREMKAWTKLADGSIVGGSGAPGEVGAPGKLTLEGMIRKYAACGQAIDDGVGELLKALEDSGQTKNTLVVFTSDQGFALGEHGFRHKLAPYDATLRSPLIFRQPDTVPEGKVCEVGASGVDFAPTFFAAAGLKLPWDMHGHDLMPLVKNPQADWPHVMLYTNTGQKFGSDTHAIPKEYPKNLQSGVPWWLAVRKGNFKYIRTLVEGEVEELYDLKTDPDELTNLAYDPKHKDTVAQMRKALEEELKRTKCGFAEKLPAIAKELPPAKK
ncbi:MAG: sulfatase-like hydrolase/transferase [Planctomycetia bacterium]|nr:sulfatase-like hydrolase/transferase [Planctomycetia bacterium]